MSHVTTSDVALLRQALSEGEGVVRMAPCWVPRAFLQPGGRLKLAPTDLYALGAHRGGISERWLSSTTAADNGPGTPADEGLSYVMTPGGKVPLRTGIDEIGDELLGADGRWSVLCKLFDNLSPIPHHLHQTEEFARRVGRNPKPEAYYYPPQLNFHENRFPYTFMGLEPGTTRDDIRRCLERWNEGDNGILYHSRAYKLKPGTGWQVDPGILHAPGTLVTYEPQVNSDVFAVFQSMVDGYAMPWPLLVKDVPAEHQQDLDYILSLIDWEKNVDPEFGRNHHFTPRPVREEAAMREAGYVEKWITWSTRHYSAKELTVLPGRTAVIRDAAAYGVIVVEGHGRMGRLAAASPTIIRHGQMTEDEFFVSAAAAQRGIAIQNSSQTGNLVMLKHFGPDNPDAAGLVGKKPYEA